MRFAFVVFTLLFAPTAHVEVRAGDAPMDIQLSNVRWQPLPRGIEQVFVGPDGRVWYQCFSRSRLASELNDIKTHIESQFREAAPQIALARIVLFEPGGRVWFYSRHKNTLLGYDGTRWTTNELQNDILNYSLVRCSTRGRLINADVHRFAGGTAWFIARQGVYAFDGENWSYQRLSAGGPTSFSRVWLSVSGDGQLAVAHVQGEAAFWLFRDGRWSEHRVFPIDRAPRVKHLVAEHADAIWIVTHPDKLRRLLIDEDGQSALTDEPVPPGETRFGGVRVSGVKALYQDATGRIILAADSVGDDNLGLQGGIVIVPSNGQPQVMTNKLAAASRWQSNYLGFQPPIFTACGKQVWLFNHGSETPAGLFDIEKKEFVAHLPDPGFSCFHAVDDAGRLFVSRGTLSLAAQQIMVFTPDGKEGKTLQASRRQIMERAWTSVTAEGAVWTVDEQGQLIRFDDGQWQVVRPASGRDRIGMMLAGGDGVVLVQAGSQWVLYRGTDEIGSGQLFGLLEKHRQLLCEAFAPDRRQTPRYMTMTLAGSRDGQLWCMTNNGVWLLSDDRWHDSIDPLLKGGSRSGGIEYLAPIGDGSSAFVSDLNMFHDGGRSFVGRIKNGKLQFAPTPHLGSVGRHSPLGVRDREGTLWLAALQGGGGRTSDWTTGQLAVRFKKDGTREQLVNAGWARLADAAGNVWLGEISGHPSDVLRIWRNGEIVQQLRVPAYEKGLLFSDRPGSVYAYTAAGLQHLIADAPDYREYRVGPLYSILGVVGRSGYQTYSSQGWLIISAGGGSPQRKNYLHMVKIPGRGDAS